MSNQMTAFQIISAVEEMRKLTCPPSEGKVVERGIDQIVEVDRLLLDLQEKLLDAFGNDSQTAPLKSVSL